MQRFFKTILLILISVNGYCQCDNNQIVFVDSLGQKVNSNQTDLIYVLNNGLDTIILDELYDTEFSKQVSLNPYGTGHILFAVDSGLNSTNSNLTKRLDTIKRCVSCRRKRVKLIDSIDLNKDGIKEIIIFRKWYCSDSPPVFQPYGVGSQQQNYETYEVWSTKTNTKIFEIKSTFESQIAVTTNVLTTHGYRFEVVIDKEGDFHLSNPSSNNGSNIEMGSYKYDNESGTYKKE